MAKGATIRMIVKPFRGRITTVDLPHVYRSIKSAWKGADFLRGLGGPWDDHDDVNSQPCQIRYDVRPCSKAD